MKSVLLFAFICFGFVSVANCNETQPFSISVALHRMDKMDNQHTKFFADNPRVLLLYWKKGTSSLAIYSKHDKIEVYDLSKADDVKKAEKKYGFLPSRTPGSISY